MSTHEEDQHRPNWKRKSEKENQRKLKIKTFKKCRQFRQHKPMTRQHRVSRQSERSIRSAHTKRFRCQTWKWVHFPVQFTVDIDVTRTIAHWRRRAHKFTQMRNSRRCGRSRRHRVVFKMQKHLIHPKANFFLVSLSHTRLSFDCANGEFVVVCVSCNTCKLTFVQSTHCFDLRLHEVNTSVFSAHVNRLALYKFPLDDRQRRDNTHKHMCASIHANNKRNIKVGKFPVCQHANDMR